MACNIAHLFFYVIPEELSASHIDRDMSMFHNENILGCVKLWGHTRTKKAQVTCTSEGQDLGRNVCAWRVWLPRLNVLSFATTLRRSQLGYPFYQCNTNSSPSAAAEPCALPSLPPRPHQTATT